MSLAVPIYYKWFENSNQPPEERPSGITITGTKVDIFGAEPCDMLEDMKRDATHWFGTFADVARHTLELLERFEHTIEVKLVYYSETKQWLITMFAVFERDGDAIYFKMELA